MLAFEAKRRGFESLSGYLNSYQKGDIAELAVAADLIKRGYGIAWPFSTSTDWDLLLIRGKSLERVQVKYRRLDSKGILTVPNRVVSNTSGKQQRRMYSKEDIDWLAMYCPETDQCYYFPIETLEGKEKTNFRTTPTANNQKKGSRFLKDFQNI